MKELLLPSLSLNLDSYDRNPILSEGEKAALAKFAHRGVQARSRTQLALSRLLKPIEDALVSVHVTYERQVRVRHFICLEMHRRGVAFWGWTIEQWCESIAPTREDFAHRYGLKPCSSGYEGRQHLALLPYLLCPHLPFDSLFQCIELFSFTRNVFGEEIINETMQRLWVVLENWGYRQKNKTKLIAGVCYLLLQSRHPSLNGLSSELLEQIEQSCPVRSVRESLFQISRALTALGLIERPLEGYHGNKNPQKKEPDESISEEWLLWCERWRHQTPQQRPDVVYHMLHLAGRWLRATHPEVSSPAQWTYELAAEFVAVIMEMKVGEWGRSSAQHPGRGQPLRAKTRKTFLSAMRVFFRDCQEWGWIPPRFNPFRAFQIPRPLRNLIGPDPRVIDKEIWAKLLWAAMNLQAADLPLSRGNTVAYPLEFVRAVAVVWCFAALRSDEIRRLRLGCVRWQYSDVMIPETGEILPKDAVCFLDIPVNKTMTAYTKAVHPLVGKRIKEWEQVRPQEQLHTLDKKTSEQVQFLFSYRGVLVSRAYINTSLIPLLCRKAGVPLQDSRGKITSHRARATIASMLYNAKEPLTILELKEYLGHKSLSSTQQYVLVDPTKLASKVAKTGYLEQNMATIEVLLDQGAVLSGAAARGEVWKYYDLGHGYCTNPFWAACAHRMACAKCPYYRPKDSTLEQLVEGKANLVHMLEFVQLTADEKLLVTEGIELHQALIEKLVDVPTPAGPTPRELEAQRQGEKKVIPIKNVRRTRSKQQEL